MLTYKLTFLVATHDFFFSFLFVTTTQQLATGRRLVETKTAIEVIFSQLLFCK